MSNIVNVSKINILQALGQSEREYVECLRMKRQAEKALKDKKEKIEGVLCRLRNHVLGIDTAKR